MTRHTAPKDTGCLYYVAKTAGLLVGRSVSFFFNLPKLVRYELVVGAALTYIGATIRSGAMAYPYLLTLKLTRKVLTSSGHLLNSIGLF